MRKADDLTSKIFKPLNGRAFNDYRSLETVVLALFNKHLIEIPPGYSYRQLIEWGRQNGWIVKAGKRGWAVLFDGIVKD